MTDTPDTHDDTWTPAPDADAPMPAPAPAPSAMPASGRPGSVLRRRAATVATLTGLTVGGIAGGYIISQAASPTPSPTGSPSTEPGHGFNGDHHGGPGHCGLAPEDLSVVAGAIGISAGDLQTALSGGQTIAAVAKAHGVDVAKVISAWTASENQEIDALVKAGRITQSQADQMKAMSQQRVTDMVNGTFRGGPHGGGFRGGSGGPGAPGLPPGSTQSSTDTSA